MRIGHGFDIHKFGIYAKPFILGGVHIPYFQGVLSHSDGDVIIHSVIDSLLGACALGDIATEEKIINITLIAIDNADMFNIMLLIIQINNAILPEINMLDKNDKFRLVFKLYMEQQKNTIAVPDKASIMLLLLFIASITFIIGAIAYPINPVKANVAKIPDFLLDK
uniref:2-C-methyl-D-erythritol 2,4-cyclodiphosphate synthase n=1 Tax=Glossina pallidipes TaxID=7398 RepID=A0A1A9Z0V2_GLOPL